MCAKLAGALHQMGSEDQATFQHVFLIDDFAGSGRTLIRGDDGQFEGKIVKLRDALAKLQAEGLVAEDVEVTVVLYVVAEQARRHIEVAMAEAQLSAWGLRYVQELPDSLRVDAGSPFAELAERYYDESSADEHKGRTPLGYSDCALPVVLSHNTPNNSISLLWADTTQDEGGLNRRALFPRYERHHKDRP
jgi:hypothetical protein